MICARCLRENEGTVYRSEYHLFLCEKCFRVRSVMREIFFGRKQMNDYKKAEGETQVEE